MPVEELQQHSIEVLGKLEATHPDAAERGHPEPRDGPVEGAFDPSGAPAIKARSGGARRALTACAAPGGAHAVNVEGLGGRVGASEGHTVRRSPLLAQLGLSCLGKVVSSTTPPLLCSTGQPQVRPHAARPLKPR